MAKRRRRRRWVWAKREMARATGFFSEDEMKQRDPQLFHHLVGQYQDSTVKLSDPMQGSLSNYLLQQLERQCEAEQLRGEGAEAAGAACSPAAKRQRTAEEALPGEMEFSNEDYYDVSGDEGGAGSDDAAVRRARFLKAMRDRFVDGMERNFNYAVLDEDSDLDDVVELGRDAEEKYFDAE
ncbi:TUL1 [Symbiodinium natans]|uniref:TUL1 protein n=1 Tax=Symbiodinium natans TaxID=878477 RepID=A0A812I9G3_9DINO|nr:TUL1 [Symbiodinium natans]